MMILIIIIFLMSDSHCSAVNRHCDSFEDGFTRGLYVGMCHAGLSRQRILNVLNAIGRERVFEDKSTGAVSKLYLEQLKSRKFE